MADDNVGVVALVQSAGARIAVTGADAGTVRFIVPVASMLSDPTHAGRLVASLC